MRFANGRKGIGPTASFISGSGMNHVLPTKPKVNLHLTTTTSAVQISGSVQRSVTGSGDGQGYVPPGMATVVMSSSLPIFGCVAYGRAYERAKYNAILLGLPEYSVNVPPWPSTVVMDTVMTGNFTSPSWTHSSIGIDQSFVNIDLSSSYVYDTHTLNLFNSGNAPLENTSVPASGVLLYSKNVRYQTIIVKHTASINDTVLGGATGTCVPTTFLASSGTYINQVTGAFGFTAGPVTMLTPNTPACFFLNVPVTGRLVNVRVWVELAHQSGANGPWPLGSLGLALRSPNVSWGHSHPMFNDPTAVASIGSVRSFFNANPYPNFYRDTFLLWEGSLLGTFAGGNAFSPPYTGFPAPDAGAQYVTWENDRGMRTIFEDGAAVPNPRQMFSGVSSVTLNYNGAPNVGAVGAPGANSCFGADVPWTSDATISSGSTTWQAAGSPPPGWLTGLGGVTGTNEWPTTGSNYGARNIRPLYPMLDAITAKQINPSEDNGTLFVNIQNWTGTRPGLRGTEISGTWTLLVVSAGMLNDTAGSKGADVYLRQWRLEITYENSQAAPAKKVRQQSANGARRPGIVPIFVISGSDNINTDDAVGAIDWYAQQVYTTVPEQCEIGRTFGLVLNTGSLPSTNYALLYRLTGNIGDISGSCPGWLTNNFMGMPSIPVSSASLTVVSPSASAPSPFHLAFPSVPLQGAARILDVAEDQNPRVNLVDLAAKFVSGNST